MAARRSRASTGSGRGGVPRVSVASNRSRHSGTGAGVQPNPLKPQLKLARDFAPVRSQAGSVSSGGQSARSGISSYTRGSRARPGRRRRRRDKESDNASSVIDVNDGWTPPPKRSVNVNRATLLAFYDTMTTGADDSGDEEDKALLARALKPTLGTRGKFLGTLGYNAHPPEYNAGHPWASHAGDSAFDALVPLNDPWVAAYNGRVEELELHATQRAGTMDANMRGIHAPHETPLHRAVSRGHTAVVQMLVASGANVDAKDENHWTPLHYAAKHGQKHCAQMMISTGATPALENRDGDTPYDLAARAGHAEVAALLEQAVKDAEKAQAQAAAGGSEE